MSITTKQTLEKISLGIQIGMLIGGGISPLARKKKKKSAISSPHLGGELSAV